MLQLRRARKCKNGFCRIKLPYVYSEIIYFCGVQRDEKLMCRGVLISLLEMLNHWCLCILIHYSWGTWIRRYIEPRKERKKGLCYANATTGYHSKRVCLGWIMLDAINSIINQGIQHNFEQQKSSNWIIYRLKSFAIKQGSSNKHNIITVFRFVCANLHFLFHTCKLSAYCHALFLNKLCQIVELYSTNCALSLTHSSLGFFRNTNRLPSDYSQERKLPF